MLCTQCGYGMATDARFCPKCGLVAATDGGQPAMDTSQPGAQEPAAWAAQPQAVAAPPAPPAQYTPPQPAYTPPPQPQYTPPPQQYTPPPQYVQPSVPPAAPAPVPPASYPPYVEQQPAAAYQAPAPAARRVIPWFNLSRKAQRVVMSIVLVMSMLLGGLGAFLTRATPSEAEAEILASLPVGPDGGKVVFADKGSLEVPKGALSKPTRITIKRQTIRDRVRVQPPGMPPVLYPPGTIAVFIFGPIDLVFLQAVTIVLPLPDLTVPGIIFVLLNGQMRFVGGAVNAANGTITIQTRDFRFTSVVT